MKIALVTGGTGKIGPLLIKELLRQNFRVRLFLRKNSILPVSILSCDVQIFYGDITDYPTVLTAVSGVDYIFHLAALLHIQNPHQFMYAKYYNINVIGTQNIINASLKTNVKRVILFSTISVYGKGLHGQTFSETSPVNPITIYAKTKLLAEAKAREAKRIFSTQTSCVTILRLASVYGRLMEGNYLRLIKAVKAGFFFIPLNAESSYLYGNDKYYGGGAINSSIQNGGALRTLINENDVVSGAILAAMHPEAAGKTYNLTDGAVHSIEEIVQAVAGALSVSVKIVKIPAKPLKIFKISSIIDKLMENIAVEGSKIHQELGFTPQYNLKMGWRDALNANGDILYAQMKKCL